MCKKPKTDRGDNIEQVNLTKKVRQFQGGPLPANSRPHRSRSVQNDSASALLVSRKEVCRLLGNISGRSVARLEERGLLRSTGLLRHKLYRRADVEALANEELNWEA